MPKAGYRTPYRQMPADFAEVYVRLGINGAKAHFHAHFRNVRRWVEQCGGDELRQKREAHLKENGRQVSISKVWSRKRLMELSRAE